MKMSYKTRKRRELQKDDRLNQKMMNPPAEEYDKPDVLVEKINKLIEFMKGTTNTVVITGAGVSTAANVPDYRGVDGLYTKDVDNFDRKFDIRSVVPTMTHMYIKELLNWNYFSHLITQNCDGLHLRSGIPQRMMSEIHGNMYIEYCIHCDKQYIRPFEVSFHSDFRRHRTTRKCTICKYHLQDTIVHAGEKNRAKWPQNWEGAMEAVEEADLILIIGTSGAVLRNYKELWPKHAKKVLINIQPTMIDKMVDLKINANCDEVMKIVHDAMDTVSDLTFCVDCDKILNQQRRVQSDKIMKEFTYCSCDNSPPKCRLVLDPTTANFGCPGWLKNGLKRMRKLYLDDAKQLENEMSADESSDDSDDDDYSPSEQSRKPSLKEAVLQYHTVMTRRASEESTNQSIVSNDEPASVQEPVNVAEPANTAEMNSSAVPAPEQSVNRQEKVEAPAAPEPEPEEMIDVVHVKEEIKEEVEDDYYGYSQQLIEDHREFLDNERRAEEDIANDHAVQEQVEDSSSVIQNNQSVSPPSDVPSPIQQVEAPTLIIPPMELHQQEPIDQNLIATPPALMDENWCFPTTLSTEDANRQNQNEELAHFLLMEDQTNSEQPASAPQYREPVLMSLADVEQPLQRNTIPSIDTVFSTPPAMQNRIAVIQSLSQALLMDDPAATTNMNEQQSYLNASNVSTDNYMTVPNLNVPMFFEPDHSLEEASAQQDTTNSTEDAYGEHVDLYSPDADPNKEYTVLGEYSDAPPSRDEDATPPALADPDLLNEEVTYWPVDPTTPIETVIQDHMRHGRPLLSLAHFDKSGNILPGSMEQPSNEKNFPERRHVLVLTPRKPTIPRRELSVEDNLELIERRTPMPDYEEPPYSNYTMSASNNGIGELEFDENFMEDDYSNQSQFDVQSPSLVVPLSPQSLIDPLTVENEHQYVDHVVHRDIPSTSTGVTHPIYSNLDYTVRHGDREYDRQVQRRIEQLENQRSAEPLPNHPRNARKRTSNSPQNSSQIKRDCLPTRANVPCGLEAAMAPQQLQQPRRDSSDSIDNAIDTVLRKIGINASGARPLAKKPTKLGRKPINANIAETDFDVPEPNSFPPSFPESGPIRKTSKRKKVTHRLEDFPLVDRNVHILDEAHFEKLMKLLFDLHKANIRMSDDEFLIFREEFRIRMGPETETLLVSDLGNMMKNFKKDLDRRRR